MHHAVQPAGFGLFPGPDLLQGCCVRVRREPVAEAGTGEVPVGEQDGGPPLWASPGRGPCGPGRTRGRSARAALRRLPAAIPGGRRFRSRLAAAQAREAGLPTRPRPPRYRGGPGLHPAAQGAFLDVSHEHEVPAACAGRMTRPKPVTKADAGEVAVREHDRHPLPRRLTRDDHFGASDVTGIATWLPWRQRIPRPRTACNGTWPARPARHG